MVVLRTSPTVVGAAFTTADPNALWQAASAAAAPVDAAEVVALLVAGGVELLGVGECPSPWHPAAQSTKTTAAARRRPSSLMTAGR